MKKLVARPLAWLAAGLCASCLAGYWQASSNEEEIATRFESVSRRAAEQVSARMRTYEFGLAGARGAIVAAGGGVTISRNRFAQYAATRNLEREFPGSRGIGFIRRVPEAEESSFVEAMRRDGVPNYTVRQMAPHAGERFLVQFIEPSGGNDVALGLDVGSEPTRREAAERAMLSGQATITPPIGLVQADAQSLRAFLLLLPVLRADVSATEMRRRARQPLSPEDARRETVGWVYQPLVIDEVMRDFDLQDGAFGLALWDVTHPEKPERFYTSLGAGGSTASKGLPTVSLPLAQFGRDWRVDVIAQKPFAQLLNLRDPLLVVAAGSLLSALVAFGASMRELTRRRKEQAGEQRSRLAAIVASSNDAIIGRRVDGTITDWNRAAAQIFGYSAADAVGKTLQELLVPPDKMNEERELNAHIANGRSVAPFETLRRRSDGRLVPVSLSAAPIRSASGKVIGAAQTLRDITHDNVHRARILELNATLEQQVAERTAEVRALSARERAMLSGAGSAIIATDADGMVTLFNPAAEELLGYPAREVLGKLPMRRFHDTAELQARSAVLSARLGRALEVGEVFAAGRSSAGGDPEWTYVRKDGTRVPVHLNVNPLRDAAGNISGFVAIATDLSERKRAEEAARDRERFMRIVTDNIPGVVAYWSPDLRCTFANSAYERWMGLKPEQMIGMSQRELLDPERFAQNEPYMRAALAGREQRVERSRQIVDGSTVHYWLHYIPDRDENGEVKGFISVAVDVTEMKQAQNQLETLNQALNERSAQAESASRAKSDFLANMSHEIRSPLNAVIGLAYLLRQTPLDSRQRDFLEKLEAAGNALLGVINDILDISKIEAGQMVLDDAEFELRALLDEAVSIMAVNAGAKNVALRLVAEPGLPEMLRGDAGRVRQIIVNLLSNAIKFTAKGSVRLEVNRQALVDGRAHLRFAVHDTGIGIAPDVLERLFTPFTQADMSTTRRFGGTGLGLSIVKQMTELMGGEYGVRSTPGEGSEFWVVLPLRVVSGSAGSQAEAENAPVAIRLPTGARLTGTRVLVVDDSPVNLEVCRHILEREGAQVQLANDGREALDTVRASGIAFDVVLMDLHMPVLDGHEATRRIRQEKGFEQLPIVALTASALVAERDRALESGVDDFISKPFDAEALIRCVRRYADKGQGGPMLDSPAQEDLSPGLSPGWPRIDGIDSRDAHARLGGDTALLRSVLRRLLDDFADLGLAPGTASASTQSLAARLHKMRGSAGMIGATGLSELAGAGEAALKAGDVERTRAVLSSLSAALRQLARSSREFLAAGEDEPDLDDTVPAPLESLSLGQLVDALRSQSMGAMTLFDSLAPSLRAALGADRFGELRQAVQDLQFRRALQVLEGAGVA